jgi:ferredoxin, 2Fe-2S
MPKVTFLPDGVTVSCADGESVFEVGRRAQIPIETACVGKATCGLCRVRVVAGEGSLSELNDHERRHLGNVYFLTKVRLSCQAIVSGGDVTVELAPKKIRARTGRS